ncbi:hypothetical protein [Parahaliea mediterranea]|uniref:Uncharacterized protein n=1 Tax=Parahaliea mediterranea TaxID=651086 RepID=A0A939DGZ2_9GAMM|nr:hypothetical protein [Parahaliea mediterranea]MBN7798083.1 hypothetical protein [Parahaliea mediterranea]
MREYIDNTSQSEVLGRLGLPPIPYPLPSDLRVEAIEHSDDPPVARLLYWLQLCSAQPGADWLGLEYAMQRLLQQLVAEPPVASVAKAVPENRVASSEHWWLELDAVPLDRELVTLERDGYMLAALAPNIDSRLVVSAYRPLDAHSLRMLTGLAAHPHPRLGVAMRENNWELAVDAAAGAENFLASEQGGAYLAHWPRGLGGAVADDVQTPLAPEFVDAQLQVYQRFARAAAPDS